MVLALVQVSKGSQYPEVLKALIVQSMIKIEEDKVTVICREADIEAVKSVVDVSHERPVTSDTDEVSAKGSIGSDRSRFMLCVVFSLVSFGFVSVCFFLDANRCFAGTFSSSKDRVRFVSPRVWCPFPPLHVVFLFHFRQSNTTLAFVRFVNRMLCRSTWS